MHNQYITRKGSFDSAHRVMDEKFKCFNLHGHLYQYELTFEFDEVHDIGFNVDFKDIKLLACDWFDRIFDHGTILNPHDQRLIDCCLDIKSKAWIMSLNGEDYCNPTAENISKEMFLSCELLFSQIYGFKPYKVKLYETPNCYVETYRTSIMSDQRINFTDHNAESIQKFKSSLNIDDRLYYKK